MINVEDFPDQLLEAWLQRSNSFIMLININADILDYNEKYSKLFEKFPNLLTLITLTHKKEFLSSIEECFTTKMSKTLMTHFSPNPDDVEDIPETYQIFMYPIDDTKLYVIAEPTPALSHENTKAYYQLVNDYATITRDAHRAQFELNKANIQLQAKIKEVNHLANHDSLTGIYNRRKILEVLEQEYERYGRQNTPFSIAMIDIDHFKDINDNYGHDAGDLVLQNVVSILQDFFRKYDNIGRFGGEEFLVILPNTQIENGVNIINRALKNLINSTIKIDHATSITISFSAGVAEISQELDIKNLIKLSDERLYKAKNTGRKQIVPKF